MMALIGKARKAAMRLWAQPFAQKYVFTFLAAAVPVSGSIALTVFAAHSLGEVLTILLGALVAGGAAGWRADRLLLKQLAQEQLAATQAELEQKAGK